MKKYWLKYSAMILVSIACNMGFAEDVDVQDSLIERCVNEATASKVADKKNASVFCACSINAQAKGLTLGEYWQLQSASLSGKSPNTLPPYKKIKPQIEACRKGLTFFNKPTP